MTENTTLTSDVSTTVKRCTDPRELALICDHVFVFRGSVCAVLEPPLDAHTILEVVYTGTLP